MKYNVFLMLFSTLFLSFEAHCQSFRYRSYSGDLELTIRKEDQKRIDSLSKIAHHIESDLPIGFKKDGTIDYTDNIQLAIDKHPVLLLPNFPILINSSGLSLISNRILIFQESSKLLMEGNDLERYALLDLTKSENVEIYNINIEGDRLAHRGNTGEWGMGVNMRGSANIKIVGGKITNFWGDGIYVGRSSDVHANNIVIENVHVDNNRRNGISITSADNLFLSNVLVSNTNGTAPQAGIDIEPNYASDMIKDIVFDNVHTYNNAADGILILLAKLTLEEKFNEVSITIDNHVDDYSYAGMRISGRDPKNVGVKFKKIEIGGFINVNNPLWRNTSEALRTSPNVNRVLDLAFLPITTISNPRTTRNMIQRIFSPPAYKTLQYSVNSDRIKFVAK